MTNDSNNPLTSDKWQIDSFTILMLHAEYLDSLEDAETLFVYKKQYDVKYDIDVHFPGDAVTVHMHALINGEGALPGYRIAFTIQTDYELMVPHDGEITQGQLTPDDMEFFIGDSHLSMQDHLLALTEDMPLGTYILPPSDLDGSIGKVVDDLIR